MAGPSTKPRRRTGRAAFLLHLVEFRALLAAGHTQRAIFDDYAARLAMSYSQFNRYMGKYTNQTIFTYDQPNPSAAPPPSRVPTASPVEQPLQRAGQTPAAKGRRNVFRHDPDSGNRRDDLI